MREALARIPKRWAAVWTDSGHVESAYHYRLIARLAARDTNRAMEKIGSSRRVTVKELS